MTAVDSLLPIFPLDLVLFPGQPVPLHIFEPRYKEMIGHCLAKKTPFGIIRLKDSEISEIGCSAEIIELTKRYDDGRMDIQAAGRRRFEVITINQEEDYLQAEVTYQEDEPGPPSTVLAQRALGLHAEIVQALAPAEDYQPPDGEDPQLSYELAGSIPIDLDFKQTLLATRAESERLSMLVDFYEQVLPKLKRAARIREKAGGNGHVL